MANMREDSNVKSLFRRGASNYSSWEYIDSVASSLKKSIENLTVIPVFDAGLVNNFKGEDIEITNKRKQLNYYDDDYIYFMREHYVEADPLILNIADELNGFVISSDQYEKYPDETRKINGNVFVPVKNRNTGEFTFFKSLEFYELRGKYRNFDDATMRGVSTLQRCLNHDSNFVKNDAIIRERVFGNDGIEVRYWEGKFQTVKQGEKKVLKDRPFANFKFAFSSTPKKDKDLKELIVNRKRRIAKKFSKTLVVFCDELDQIEVNVDSEVHVVGKLGRSGDQIFIEWFRGDKAVLISNFSTKKDLDRGFIKISGHLSKGNHYFELERDENVLVEQLSFDDAVVHRLSRLVSRIRDEPRRWHLPSLQWGENAGTRSIRQNEELPLHHPPRYRYPSADDALSESDLEQTEAHVETDKPESLISTDRNAVLQIIDESAGDSQKDVVNGKQAEFELSDPPSFGESIRKKRTQSDIMESRSRLRKLLYIALLLFAVGAAYIAWDRYVIATDADSQGAFPRSDIELNLDKSSYSVQIANASARVWSAGELSIELKSRGFVLDIATTKSTALPIQRETIVYYLPSHLGAAAVVSRELGGVKIAEMPLKIPTRRGELDDASVLVLLGSDIAGKPLGVVAEFKGARQIASKCWGEVEKICVEV